MKKAVHIQTTLNTVFGILDDNDDIIEQVPVSLTLGTLRPETFQKALEHIIGQKQELQVKVSQSEAVEKMA